MPLVFTAPMRDKMLPEVQRRIERSYREFPEFEERRVVVGVTRNRRLQGYAVGKDFCIRLYVSRKSIPSFHVIGHELTHLLQKPGLGTVPSGEVQCDIWTLARSQLFLDRMPGYLSVHPCTQEDWTQHAGHIRDLCIRAIEVRKINRNYIVWLKDMLRQYFRCQVSGARFQGQGVR